MSDLKAHFNQLYQSSDDPWSVESNWFERRKADLLLAMLPLEKYESVFEPACGIGVMSYLLAKRSDRLLAVDFSQTAVDAARDRLREFSGASTALMDVPDEWPSIGFDLIVLSEYAYYLEESQLDKLLARLKPSRDSADIICCNSTIDFDDRNISVAHLSKKFEEELGLPTSKYVDDRFEIALWTSPQHMPLPANAGAKQSGGSR